MGSTFRLHLGGRGKTGNGRWFCTALCTPTFWAGALSQARSSRACSSGSCAFRRICSFKLPGFFLYAPQEQDLRTGADRGKDWPGASDRQTTYVSANR